MIDAPLHVSSLQGEQYISESETFGRFQEISGTANCQDTDMDLLPLILIRARPDRERLCSHNTG